MSSLLNGLPMVLLYVHLRTFFKSFVCAHVSFAHRNVYHLCTVLVLHLRTCFAPIPWPAAGILLYQGTCTINKISALLPGGGRVRTGLHSHLKVNF